MNDQRFLRILNQAAEDAPLTGGTTGGRPDEAGAVAAWARFLHACVARGVSVGDPRWRRLELRLVGGRPRFSLPSDPEAAPPEDDFSVGLALLMGMLGREDPR
jgi:hypothetical protein